MEEQPPSPPRSKRRRLNSPEAGPACDVLRIYSWNINGISPFIQPTISSYFQTQYKRPPEAKATRASLRDFLRRHKWPTVLFLQEVKINPGDSATIRAVEQAVRKQVTESPDAFDYEAHFCLPSDKYNAKGFGRKVYGVCSIVRKDFKERCVDRIRPVDWDVEGRILVLETRAVGLLPKLAIINIYAVNGTDNPYYDPQTGKEAGTRHERKLQIHRFLQTECRALEAAGFKVVLAGDLNIARSPADGYPNLRTFPKQHCLNRADFEARFLSTPTTQDSTVRENAPGDDDASSNSSMEMVDTFRHLHPTQKSYTFYPRTKTFGESCDRVDLILISSKLKDALVEAGMHETAAERGTSDHVPLFASLDLRRCKDMSET